VDQDSTLGTNPAEERKYIVDSLSDFITKCKFPVHISEDMFPFAINTIVYAT
jgi:hypothetical protein